MSKLVKTDSTLGVVKEKQLDSITKVLVTLASALIFVLGLKFIAADLIAPILMAFFLAILVRPVFNFYRRKGLSRGISLLLVITTIVLILVALILLITYSISILQSSLSVYTDGLKESISRLSQDLGINSETTEMITQSISPESVTRLASAIMGSLGSLTLYLIIVPILAILIILEIDKVPGRLSSEMLETNPKLIKLKKFADSVMIYVVGRFKVNLVTGILFAISLLVLDVDFPYFWGVMTIFLSFIPYLGILLAATSPTLLALADQGVFTAAMVVLAVVLINLFSENILEPMIQGRGNKISPAAIVVSVIFWGWMLGAVGMILAAPLTVLLKLVLIDYKETAWIGQVIEGDFSGIPESGKADSSRFDKAKSSIKSIFTK